MDKSHFISLTLSVYRVTDLFPEKEPLRFLLRKKVDDILRDLTLMDSYLKNFSFYNKPSPLDAGFLTRQTLRGPLERVLRNVAVLDVYFKIAEKQNWLKPENFLVLRAEYGAIEQEMKRLRQEKTAETAGQAASQSAIKRAEPKKSKAIISNSIITAGLKSRQQRILLFLKKRGKAQIQDLKKDLPEVTKRTLRRDMDFLLKNGLVERLGDKIKTEYKLKV